MSAPAIEAVPRATPVVHLGVGASYNPTGTGIWGSGPSDADASSWGADASDPDAGKWRGDNPLWLDISCYVHEVETFAGRERSTESFDVGTAVVTVKNDTGWADYPPTNADLPTDPLLEVIPGREIRVGVRLDDGDPVFFWRGTLDRTAPGYAPNVGDIVTLEAIDAKGDAGRASVESLDVEVGVGETAGQRVARILNAIGWPTTRRAIDGSSVLLLGTTLGSSAADLMNLAADSSGGSVYGDVNGKVVYRARDWQTIIGKVPVDGTIGNIGGGDVVVELPADPEWGYYDPSGLFTENPVGSGLYEETSTLHYLQENPRASSLYVVIKDNPPAVCPSSWDIAFAREEVATRVIVARHTDETPRTFNDLVGQGIIGVETYERTDLETQTTTDLDAIGSRLLATRSYKRMPRVSAVEIDAGANPIDGAELLANASPFKPSRYSCAHTSGDRVVFNRLMMLIGIEHTITPQNWTARLALDDVSPYQIKEGGRWGLDQSDPDADVGRWEETVWSRAV